MDGAPLAARMSFASQQRQLAQRPAPGLTLPATERFSPPSLNEETSRNFDMPSGEVLRFKTCRGCDGDCVASVQVEALGDVILIGMLLSVASSCALFFFDDECTLGEESEAINHSASGACPSTRRPTRAATASAQFHPMLIDTLAS